MKSLTIDEENSRNLNYTNNYVKLHRDFNKEVFAAKMKKKVDMLSLKAYLQLIVILPSKGHFFISGHAHLRSFFICRIFYFDNYRQQYC